MSDRVDDDGLAAETTEATAAEARLRVLRKRRAVCGGALALLSTAILFVWSSPILFVVAGVMAILFVPFLIANNEIVRLTGNDSGNIFDVK